MACARPSTSAEPLEEDHSFRSAKVLFFFNLNKRVHYRDIKKLLVTNKIHYKKITVDKDGEFGFVYFDTQDYADLTIDLFDGYNFGGTIIGVQPAFEDQLQSMGQNADQREQQHERRRYSTGRPEIHVEKPKMKSKIPVPNRNQSEMQIEQLTKQFEHVSLQGDSPYKKMEPPGKTNELPESDQTQGKSGEPRSDPVQFWNQFVRHWEYITPAWRQFEEHAKAKEAKAREDQAREDQAREAQARESEVLHSPNILENMPSEENELPPEEVKSEEVEVPGGENKKPAKPGHLC